MQNKHGSIPRSFIDELLNRTDIVQIINQRVPLKKSSSGYKACCPFHSEKTPSFNVNQTKQFYHCFGCGVGGNVLTFIMEYEGLSFVDAVESLASLYGMQIPYEKSTKEARRHTEQQKSLYDVMHDATIFYRQQLRDNPQAQKAKIYLRKRGLTPEVAKTFRIGYAPADWNSLERDMPESIVLTQQLMQAGLLVQKENGKYYDRFRERIMFPIRDIRGRVIAFGGRILGEGKPKYLNSPETPIFHKSFALYGLYELKKSRAKIDYIIVVEGYLDVIALYQFGIYNSVATLGTATTPEHLNVLFNNVNEIIFCFDGDEAGLKAAWKALEISLPLIENDRSVKFLFLDKGEDPDSTVRKEGLDGFNKRINSSHSLSNFLMEGLQGRLKASLNTAEGRQHMVALATPFVKKSLGLFQFLLVESIANLVQLPAWRLEKEMGVRSGFATLASKKLSKQSLNALHKHNLATSGVTTLPLKLIRLLFKRPLLAKIFDKNFIAGMKNFKQQDYILLANTVDVLQKNGYIFDLLVKWFEQNNLQDLLNILLSSDLPDDDNMLKSEFHTLMNSLAKKMATKHISEQGWNKTTLKQLAELIKNP